jgi:hypothetical protein
LNGLSLLWSVVRVQLARWLTPNSDGGTAS